MAKKFDSQIENYAWSKKDLLGQGGFGTVYKGHNLKKLNTDDEICAVKLMNYAEIQKEPLLMELWGNESKALKLLKGKNTVNAFDIIEKDGTLYVIAPICNGGDLRKLINKRQGKPFSEVQAKQIFYDCILGMQEVYNNKMVHRDLKPENVFIHNGVYKIADFGFCGFLKRQNDILDLMAGTPGYMCPQIVFEKSYTQKCDIWTMGIIYYELLFGNIPGIGQDDKARIKDINKNGVQFPSNIRISQSSRDFIQNTLQIDENKRWSWTQVFDSQLIKEMQSGQITDQPIQKQVQLINKEDLDQNLLDFFKVMQNWILSKNPNGLEKVMKNYFPRGSINFEEFKKFCEKSSLTNEQKKLAFDYLDYEKDGEVTQKEFKYRLIDTNYEQTKINPILIDQRVKAIIKEIKLEIKQQEIDLQDLFQQNTEEKDHEMHLEQFKQFMRKVKTELTDYELEMTFNYFDSDNNGQISQDEYYQVLTGQTYYGFKVKKIKKFSKSVLNFICCAPSKNKYKEK